jgi:hypothetical protein
MGCSSLRRKRVCRPVPAILMREELEQVRSAPAPVQVRVQVQLEQARLEQVRLECAGSTPTSCASVYPEAPRVLFDHMRRRARRGTQGSTDALFSWREYTAWRAAEV